METTKILTANVLDIVFDGRNKSYGAYELRTNYERRMAKALWLTMGICMVIAASAWLKNAFAKPEERELFKIHEGLVIEEIKPIEEELPPPPPPPPAPKVEVPKVQTVKFTTPVITDEAVVEPPPAQTDLVQTRISNISQDGLKDMGIVMPPESADKGRGLVVGGPKADPDEGKIFTKVEIDASYIGNWKNFLERNLSGEVPAENNAPSGTYTVIIQFVVDTKGNVSDIKALTNHGFGMEQEAMRVIKKSGKWKPAFQNSHEVTAFRKQPIIFQVMEQ